MILQFLDDEELEGLSNLARQAPSSGDTPPPEDSAGPPGSPPDAGPGEAAREPAPVDAVLAAFGHLAGDDGAGGGGLTAQASASAEETNEKSAGDADESRSHSIEPGMLVAAQQLLALLSRGAGGASEKGPTSNVPSTEAANGAPKPRRGPPELKRYDVPIDETLLASKNLVYELTLRMLEVGLAQSGRKLPRFDVQGLYYQVPWDTLPTDTEVRDKVSVALQQGRRTLLYRSNGLEIALANQDRQNLERMKAHAEFRRLLADSTYAGDAFLSFFIAHVNAPIALANDAVSLAWRGATLNGIITDAEPPQLPKLDYVGEFGQKYGESVLETGAKMGLLLVVGGPLATQVGSASSKAATLLGELSIGGVKLGTLALNAARISMATGAAIDVIELSQVVLSLLYDAVTTTGEDREDALQKLQEVAVYGAMEWIVSRGSKKADASSTGPGDHGNKGTTDGANGHASDAPDGRSSVAEPVSSKTRKSGDSNQASEREHEPEPTARDDDVVDVEEPEEFEIKFPDHDIAEPIQEFSIEQVKRPTFSRKLNFVVLPGGRLVFGRIANKPGGGHIDLAAGSKVLAAGEAKIVKGNLVYIDNSSGHYGPRGDSARQVAETAFRRAGFDIDGKYIEKEFRDGKWVPVERRDK